MSLPRYCLHLCDGPSCGIARNSERLLSLACRTIDSRGDLRGRVYARNYTCFGRCDDGPNMFVETLAPGNDGLSDPEPEVLEDQRGFYPGLDEDKLTRILDRHCGAGEVVDDLVDRY